MALPVNVQSILTKFGIPITQTVPPASQTPIGPGTIATTSAGFWESIPTAVKVGGAALLAFIGYKKFLSKPKQKAAAVNGLRGLFGTRRRRR